MIIYGSQQAWFDQRNNSWRPGSTCPDNSIAAAMGTCYGYYDLHIPKDLDEQLIKDISGRMPKWQQWLNRINPKATARPDQVFAFWPDYFKMAQDRWPGFSAIYYGDAGIPMSKVASLVRGCYPVVIATAFLGSRDGHLVCAVGEGKDYLDIHDSWGNLHTNYRDKNGRLIRVKKNDPRWGGALLHCVSVDYEPPGIDTEAAEEEYEEDEDDDDET